MDTIGNPQKILSAMASVTVKTPPSKLLTTENINKKINFHQMKKQKLHNNKNNYHHWTIPCNEDKKYPLEQD